MFIRARKSKGTTYYQLVRGYRDENGKVRHETIGLGQSPSVADKIKSERRELRRWRRERSKWAWAVDQNSDLAKARFEKFDRKVNAAERLLARLEEAARHMSVDTTAGRGVRLRKVQAPAQPSEGEGGIIKTSEM